MREIKVKNRRILRLVKKTSGFRPILTPDQLGAPLTDYKEKTPKSNPDFLKLKIFYFEHIQPDLAGRR